MKKAFFDTNVLIAFVFLLNSLHSKSQKAFDKYDEFFWSNFVKDEFDRRYFNKQKNVKLFFKDLQKYLKNPNQEFFSAFDLNNFARKNYSGKLRDDAKSSISPFWEEYLGVETQISFLNMKNAIDFCLRDISLTLNNSKKNLENKMRLTPQRTNNYFYIDKLLKNQGVEDADRTVTLDGHDFACFNSSPVDFVTFDDACFNGASNVEALCFESVKGKYDFAS